MKQGQGGRGGLLLQKPLGPLGMWGQRAQAGRGHLPGRPGDSQGSAPAATVTVALGAAGGGDVVCAVRTAFMWTAFCLLLLQGWTREPQPLVEISTGAVKRGCQGPQQKPPVPGRLQLQLQLAGPVAWLHVAPGSGQDREVWDKGRQ